MYSGIGRFAAIKFVTVQAGRCAMIRNHYLTPLEHEVVVAIAPGIVTCSVKLRPERNKTTERSKPVSYRISSSSAVCTGWSGEHRSMTVSHPGR